MIVRIGKSKDILNVLRYNQNKVKACEASILYLHKVAYPLYKVEDLSVYFQRYFQAYLLKNISTQRPVRHISLNPHPKDKLSDKELLLIAKTYMAKVNLENQPYIVYKHFDLKRIHIHIATIAVNLWGKKIEKLYDYSHAHNACREITKEFGLTGYQKKDKGYKRFLLDIVNHAEFSVYDQINSVVCTLPKHYLFTSFKKYNALLSLFNVHAIKSKRKDHVFYVALDKNKNKASNIFSCHRFDLVVDEDFLKSHYNKSTQLRVDKTSELSELKKMIQAYFKQSKSFSEFKKLLKNQGINIVELSNKLKKDFVFISHELKVVFNFKKLSQKLNSKDNSYFNTLRKKIENPIKNLVLQRYNQSQKEYKDLQSHESFNFLEDFMLESNQSSFVCFFNYLLSGPSFDMQEKQFEDSIKKKKKKSKSKYLV